jgi:hypothetical protein
VADDAPHFAGTTEFTDAEFVEEVRFERPTFGEPPTMREVAFRESLTVRDPTVEGGVIDLRNSDVPGGHLGQSDGGSVVYDLEGVTLGDVDVEGGEGSPFEHCRFVHTTFDGFDFGKYRDSVAAANWRIHTTLDALDRETPSRGDLEATYLKAKNGANVVGDDKAAAEFFRRELEYRRRGYRTRIRRAEGIPRRLVAASRWVANALLEASSGYGARPSRVVLFSLAIVVGFAPAFWFLRPVDPYPSLPVPGLGYVLLSFESFATGMRFGGPTLEEPTVRLVSEVETFVGAFMVGLFVFTLTRSINR